MIPQALSWWCFSNRGVEPEQLISGAAKIGYKGIDLIEEALWPTVKKNGMKITAINGHGNGLNRPENGPAIEKEIRGNILKASEWQIPILICFTGNREGLSDADGLRNCAETLSRIAPVAADAGVTLAVELFNSKVDHPDYMGDSTAWGVELCKQVNSPAVKILYDIYHMQIMEGDIIRTIKANSDYFAHYHTAGNPGRSQPDETQEIYYPAIYRAIAATGYKGVISHEFVPTINPLEALKKAFVDCENALKS